MGATAFGAIRNPKPYLSFIPAHILDLAPALFTKLYYLAPSESPYFRKLLHCASTCRHLRTLTPPFTGDPPYTKLIRNILPTSLSLFLSPTSLIVLSSLRYPPLSSSSRLDGTPRAPCRAFCLFLSRFSRHCPFYPFALSLQNSNSFGGGFIYLNR